MKNSARNITVSFTMFVSTILGQITFDDVAVGMQVHDANDGLGVAWRCLKY